MKYTLAQFAKQFVLAGMVVPNLVLPVDQQKIAQLAPVLVQKNATPVTQEESKPVNLNVDLNKVIPVEAADNKVEIAVGISKFDAERRASFEKHLEQVTEPSLEQKRALVQKIAQEKGIDAKILEAVWQVESGKAWKTGVRSSAGAQGPAQFMPSTFRKYAEDFDGDGKADITSAHDSLAAAANLLVANGLKDGNARSALLAYNHANWYVDKVLNVAESIK